MLSKSTLKLGKELPRLHYDFRETRFAVKRLLKVDYEFETEALADFKHSILSNKDGTNHET